jgi:type IV fimbrial biogenesis protein FimT
MKLRAGFTIIELMVTLAVVAVVVTVGVPAFTDFVRNQRATSQANDLLVALNFARSEAVKRGRSISVCATDNPGAAEPDCSGDNEWHDGWIVFLDVDAAGGASGPDGIRNPDGTAPDDRVLRIHEALDASTLTADGGATWIAFDREGLAPVRNDFTLRPDGCSGTQVRSIDVQPTGRARVTTEDC